MPTNLTDYRDIFLNDVPMMDVRADRKSVV